MCGDCFFFNLTHLRALLVRNRQLHPSNVCTHSTLAPLMHSHLLRTPPSLCRDKGIWGGVAMCGQHAVGIASAHEYRTCAPPLYVDLVRTRVRRVRGILGWTSPMLFHRNANVASSAFIGSSGFTTFCQARFQRLPHVVRGAKANQN